MSVTVFFFFNDTATTEIYTLSLHDALPISSAVPLFSPSRPWSKQNCLTRAIFCLSTGELPNSAADRSEEHTSELQSRLHLVCRLLLEKKKQELVLHTLNSLYVRQLRNRSHL